MIRLIKRTPRLRPTPAIAVTFSGAGANPQQALVWLKRIIHEAREAKAARERTPSAAA